MLDQKLIHCDWWTILIPYNTTIELERKKWIAKKNNDVAMQKMVSRAQKFINETMREKHPHFSLETVAQHNNVIIIGGIKFDDDYIYNCCMYLKNERKKPIIVSEDIGVMTRSFAFGLDCNNVAELLSRLNNPPN